MNPVASANPTTSPAWETVDRESRAPSGQPCNACGCPVEPSDKFCPACGTPQQTGSANASRPPARKTPQQTAERDAPLADVVRETEAGGEVDSSAETAAHHQARAAQKFFRCQNCSSEVATSPDARSYVCPFCDSTYVIEIAPEVSGRQPPEFIIGFAVQPHEAQEKFHQWISGNGWFQPADLSRSMVADKMKGVYLPFWSFSMLAESRWAAEIGEHWHETESYTDRDANGNTVTRTRQVQHTEWFPLSGAHHRYYSGYLVSGSKGLPQSDADRIQPFSLPALKRYEPYFLAGWLCEEYSVSRDDALARSQQVFYQWEQQHVANFMPGNTQRGLQVQTQFRQISSDLCLLPVYVLSYRYHDKLYRFLVNGQTGRVAGDKPVSGWRVGCAIAAGIGFVILLVFLLMALGGR